MLFGVLAVFISGCGGSNNSSEPTYNKDTTQSDMQSLGKKVFFETDLSSGRNQSCASCSEGKYNFKPVHKKAK
jgi:cytochrome c peroxidase